jgi:nicotinamide-nucleotide amidase
LSPTVGLLTIGDELLNGSLTDTNSGVIARQLAEIGLAVQEVRTLPDATSAIVDGIRQMAETVDIMILTGGLGSTVDDLTVAAVAKAFDRRSRPNKSALQLIEEYCRKRGRPPHPRDYKSAEFPDGASPLRNPSGTAPGLYLSTDTVELFALPGVPTEMLAILAESILPFLQQRFDLNRLEPERIVTLIGIAEPQVEAELADIEFPPDVVIAFGVSFPFVQLKLRANGEGASGRLEQAVQLASAHFSDRVVAFDQQTIAERTGELLRLNGKTLALAESCTGGLISKLLTDAPGASDFLERSGVTYANSAKADWLNVSQQILDQEGAVSTACARAMAEGVRTAAGSDLALSVTGIAGPNGGTADKPVGTVFIGLTDANATTVLRHQFSGNRQQVRMRTACTALAMIQQYLLE